MPYDMKQFIIGIACCLASLAAATGYHEADGQPCPKRKKLAAIENSARTNNTKPPTSAQAARKQNIDQKQAYSPCIDKATQELIAQNALKCCICGEAATPMNPVVHARANSLNDSCDQCYSFYAIQNEAYQQEFNQTYIQTVLIKKLIKNSTINAINQADSENTTPLFVAIANYHASLKNLVPDPIKSLKKEVIIDLLEKGAAISIDVASNYEQKTPLDLTTDPNMYDIRALLHSYKDLLVYTLTLPSMANPEAPPIKRMANPEAPPIRGIENRNNICYINVVLQVLAKLYATQIKAASTNEMLNSAQKKLAQSLSEIIGKLNTRSDIVITIEEIKDFVLKMAPFCLNTADLSLSLLIPLQIFQQEGRGEILKNIAHKQTEYKLRNQSENIGEHQDAHEFFMKLFENLGLDGKNFIAEDRLFIKKNDKMVTRISRRVPSDIVQFSVQDMNYLLSTKTGTLPLEQVSYRVDMKDDWSAITDNKVDSKIISRIYQELNKQHAHSDENIPTIKCNTYTLTAQEEDYYIPIQVRRFLGGGVKDTDPLDNPLILALPNASGAKINLVAFIEHQGTVSFGHYVAYIKDKEYENRWWVADDDKTLRYITGYDAIDKAKQAYLLFYKVTHDLEEEENTICKLINDIAIVDKEILPSRLEQLDEFIEKLMSKTEISEKEKIRLSYLLASLQKMSGNNPIIGRLVSNLVSKLKTLGIDNRYNNNSADIDMDLYYYDNPAMEENGSDSGEEDGAIENSNLALG